MAFNVASNGHFDHSQDIFFFQLQFQIPGLNLDPVLCSCNYPFFSLQISFYWESRIFPLHAHLILYVSVANKLQTRSQIVPRLLLGVPQSKSTTPSQSKRNYFSLSGILSLEMQLLIQSFTLFSIFKLFYIYYLRISISNTTARIGYSQLESFVNYVADSSFICKLENARPQNTKIN